MDSFHNKKVPLRFLPAFSFGSPKVNREFLDDELAWKLLKKAEKGDLAAVKALDFMARFNEEFHRSYFRGGKGDKATLHKTPDLQRKLQDSINSKRKDIWGSRSRRLPLSPNEAYPDVHGTAYELTAEDKKVIASVSKIALTRAEIIAQTGLKKWLVYSRVKTLQEHGLLKLVKRDRNHINVRFVSTKSLV